MNLKQLQYFIKLSETEHYRKAAESLYITEPSLNRSIRDLEKELGVHLFEKRGRNIYLTRYGRIFLPYVTKSLSELEHGIDVMRAYTSPDKGRINLGFIYTMGYTVVPEMIMQFKNSPGNSQISFDFRQGTTSDLLAELKEETIDLAFCSSVEDASELTFYPVAEEKLVVIAPKGHPLSNRGSVSIRELEQYPFISFNKESGLYTQIKALFTAAGTYPEVVTHIEEDNAMAGFVTAGYGVAVIPDFYTLQYYDLDRIPIADPMEKRYIYLAVYKQANMLPVVERFRNFVLSRWKRGLI